MSRNSLLVIALVAWALASTAWAAPPTLVESPPAQPPEWIAPFRLRYTLNSGEARPKEGAKSVIAKLPTGGLLRADASDLAVQSADGKRLPFAVLSHDPLGGTVIQFPRDGKNDWYYAYAVAGDAELPEDPTKAEAAEPAQEGLTVEVRRWVGENIDDWTSVREGLTASENVIGNAIVADVVENCNPVRPNDPRNYASSYRGFLNIPKDGVYRFFTNSEDAAFLFIDGYKVIERGGNNVRATGHIKVNDIGENVELKKGVHPFEVHHVMGNNPSAIGYCTLMWVPPGEKVWAFVPPAAFVGADVARVAQIDEVEKRPAAHFMYGIEDTLRSGDGTLVYLVRFHAVGPQGNDKSLEWNFGDGTTGRGATVTKVYFEGGDYEVTLKSGDLPPYRNNVHVWPAPGDTSPLSLETAMASLAASPWQRLDTNRLNRMFQFLVVCEQPDRWPLIDAVTKKLLADPGIELKQKVIIYRTRMESLAHQGKAEEAIKLGEEMLKEFGRVPSLQVGIKLQIAQIYHRHLKKLDEASKLYEQIVNENRRLEHPDVRIAAIRWGDLYAETGDLRKAGECYRMAGALGGEAFQASSLTGAITRGGLLRTAEQKLKVGDIQQTLQLLDRIELNYPEEKLEGLYRVLRADADRRTGHYEDALRNYEILLKLTQWSGFHDRALQGMADTYVRLGDYAHALEWLDLLQKSYPDYYQKEELADQRKRIEARQAAAANAKTGTLAETPKFVDVEVSLDPAKIEPLVIKGLKVSPGLGIIEPYVAVGANFPTYNGHTDIQRKLADLSGGEYWLELWYRDSMMSRTLGPHLHLWMHDQNGATHASQALPRLDRTFGVWRRVGVLVRVPSTTASGDAAFSLRHLIGLYEINGFSIRAVTDRQSDALNNFLKGSEEE